jgi:hypothetical protein
MRLLMIVLVLMMAGVAAASDVQALYFIRGPSVVPPSMNELYALMANTTASCPIVDAYDLKAKEGAGDVTVTLLLRPGATQQEIEDTVALLCETYAGYLQKHPNDMDYLRVRIWESNTIIAEWTAAARELRNEDLPGTIKKVLAGGKYVFGINPEGGAWTMG